MDRFDRAAVSDCFPGIDCEKNGFDNSTPKHVEDEEDLGLRKPDNRLVPGMRVTVQHHRAERFGHCFPGNEREKRVLDSLAPKHVVNGSGLGFRKPDGRPVPGMRVTGQNRRAERFGHCFPGVEREKRVLDRSAPKHIDDGPESGLRKPDGGRLVLGRRAMAQRCRAECPRLAFENPCQYCPLFEMEECTSVGLARKEKSRG